MQQQSQKIWEQSLGSVTPIQKRRPPLIILRNEGAVVGVVLKVCETSSDSLPAQHREQFCISNTIPKWSSVDGQHLDDYAYRESPGKPALENARARGGLT